MRLAILVEIIAALPGLVRPHAKRIRTNFVNEAPLYQYLKIGFCRIKPDKLRVTHADVVEKLPDDLAFIRTRFGKRQLWQRIDRKLDMPLPVAIKNHTPREE